MSMKKKSYFLIVLVFCFGGLFFCYNQISKGLFNRYLNQRWQHDSSLSEPSFESLLVNYKNPIPKDYDPCLVNFVDYKNKTFKVSLPIAKDLYLMFEDAKKQGIDLCINSSFRNFDEQKEIFDDEVDKHINKGFSKDDAKKMAENKVAYPGTSEHETGLAVDVGLFGKTTWDKGYGWLMKNSYKYGFILRYPKGKEAITGVQYEPWHYRYVGKKAAKEIFEQNLCLEEYLN